MSELLNLDQKIKKLSDFFADYSEVLTVFLFGSYGTENQTILSDIDFAVYFNKEISVPEELDFSVKLSDILQTDRVDLLNLNRAPLLLQFRAVSQGKIIYEKDYITTCDYIEKVVGLYQDYAIDLHYFYKDYDEALKEAYFNG